MKLNTSYESSHTLVRFDSFADYVAAAEAPNPSHLIGNHFNKGNEWAGYATLAQARDLMSSGWEKGANRVRSISDRVKQAIPDSVLSAFRPEQVFDVTGELLDVGRFLDGEPECFMDEIVPERGDQIDGNGIVRITINLWASAGITPQELETRGVFVAALADVLESIGYRAQIDGYVASATDHDVKGKLVKRPLVISFPIKRPDEALEIDRVSFVLAHAASLRQIGFHVMDVCGSRAKYYGSPCALPKVYEGNVPVNALHFRDLTDFDTAKQILSQLKALGIDLDLDESL